VRVVDDRIEVRLGVLLLHLERVHQLGGEDLLRAGVHLLLARREALLVLADGQVADDLGQLHHVAGLDLLAVVLEPAVPVLGHLRHVVAQHAQHLLHRLFADDAAEAGAARVLARDHDRHVVVEDLDGEVLARLTQDLLLLLLDDLAGPVVRVDHVIAHLVLDVGDLTGDLEVFDLLLNSRLGNDVLLVKMPTDGRPSACLSGLQIPVHEVDLLQPAQALANVLGTHVADPLDGLQLTV
jgi:hypothetical protein